MYRDEVGETCSHEEVGKKIHWCWGRNTGEKYLPLGLRQEKMLGPILHLDEGEKNL